MNHIIGLAITIIAFSSGLFVIYKFIRSKYVSYDTTPIHYWLNKKQKIKKRYKTFKKYNLNRRNKSFSKLNKVRVTYKYASKSRK